MSEVELSLALAEALREILILRERNKRLVTTLEWYADLRISGVAGDSRTFDLGGRARQALSETGEK